MENPERKFKYGAKWSLLIIGFVAFCAAVSLFCYKAIHDTAFFWIPFALSVLMLFVFILGGYFKAQKTVYLILNDKGITIPPIGFQKETSSFLFDDILSVEETMINRNYVLTIYSKDNERAISKILLPKKTDYEEVKRILFDKVRG